MSEEEIRLDQTKRVFDTLAELISKKQTCTYRYLIYDLLGFSFENYAELMSGLTITNALVDMEDLQQKVEQLEKEKNTLMYSLTLVRQKWNNDKARYRRKAKVYREQRNQLENIRKEAIEFILKGRYGEDDDLESISIYVPDLLNILNKGSE